MEPAQLTDVRPELSDDTNDIIQRKLTAIEETIPSQKDVEITYFVSDLRKEGGSIYTVSGNIKKIDTYKRVIVFENDTCICMDDIMDIK